MADLDITIGLDAVTNDSGLSNVIGRVQELARAFDELAHESDRASEVFGALRVDIREAFTALDGQVSKLTLAAQANRLFAAGVEVNSNELRAMAVRAKEVADATGQEFEPTFERLVNVVRRGKDRLHEFGVEGNNTSEMLRSLTDNFGTATDKASSAADQIDQMTVEWEELRLAFADGVSKEIPEVLTGLRQIADAFGLTTSNSLNASTAAAAFGRTMVHIAADLAHPIVALNQLVTGFEQLRQQLGRGQLTSDALRRAGQLAAIGRIQAAQGQAAADAAVAESRGTVLEPLDVEGRRTRGVRGGRRRNRLGQGTFDPGDSRDQLRELEENARSLAEARGAAIQAEADHHAERNRLSREAHEERMRLIREGAAAERDRLGEMQRNAGVERAIKQRQISDFANWTVLFGDIAKQSVDLFGGSEADKNYITAATEAVLAVKDAAVFNYYGAVLHAATSSFAVATAIKQDSGGKSKHRGTPGGTSLGGAASPQQAAAPSQLIGGGQNGNGAVTYNVTFTGQTLVTRDDIDRAIHEAILRHADNGQPIPRRAVSQ